MPPVAIAWAERQSGVLTRAQLISFGLHDSQVARLVRQQVLDGSIEASIFSEF